LINLRRKFVFLQILLLLIDAWKGDYGARNELSQLVLYVCLILLAIGAMVPELYHPLLVKLIKLPEFFSGNAVRFLYIGLFGLFARKIYTLEKERYLHVR
jgi:hypothetical protein